MTALDYLRIFFQLKLFFVKLFCTINYTIKISLVEKLKNNKCPTTKKDRLF